MKGYVHSLQSMGTVDGPGVRAVVFLDGCPLRCAYCHNPDTWERREEHLTDAQELSARILRLYPYIKDGGVTFSGGEPCLQAEFAAEVAEAVKEKGLHVALDTCGEIDSPAVDRLLSLTDLVLLDIKMTTEEDYRRYTGGSLARAMAFLEKLEKLGKDTWIRHVVVPTVNDREEDVLRLSELIRPFSCVKKVELLPFPKLCVEKYRTLGIPFPFEDLPQMDAERLSVLSALLGREYKFSI